MDHMLLVRLLPHGQPLPDGWMLSDQMLNHHSEYGALIEKRVDPIEFMQEGDGHDPGPPWAP